MNSKKLSKKKKNPSLFNQKVKKKKNKFLHSTLVTNWLNLRLFYSRGAEKYWIFPSHDRHNLIIPGYKAQRTIRLYSAVSGQWVIWKRSFKLGPIWTNQNTVLCEVQCILGHDKVN